VPVHSGTKGRTSLHQDAVSEACIHDVVDGGNTCKFISKDMCFKQSYSINKESFMATDEWRRCLSFKRSCAIVGSSAHLLNASLGKDIDDLHEVVIRVNGAPGGYGKHVHLADHVGSRTDVRFLNQFARFPQEELADSMCLFLHEPSISCGKGCWIQKGCNLAECNVSTFRCRGKRQKSEYKWGNNHVFLDDVSGHLADGLRRGAGRTAGLVAISYALHTCDEVAIYGFGPTCDGELGARYYENDRPVWLGHGYNAELEMLKGLAHEGIEVPSDLQSLIHAQTFTMNVPKCLEAKAFWKSSAPPTFARSVSPVPMKKLLKARVNYIDVPAN